MARGQLHGRGNQVAAQHPKGMGLLLGHEPGSDDDIVALLNLVQHGGNELGTVLSVRVELDGVIVTLPIGVFEARLEGSGQA